MQLLINVLDDKINKSNFGKDEARIPSVFFMSKKLSGASYLIFNTKKGN